MSLHESWFDSEWVDPKAQKQQRRDPDGHRSRPPRQWIHRRCLQRSPGQEKHGPSGEPKTGRDGIGSVELRFDRRPRIGGDRRPAEGREPLRKRPKRSISVAQWQHVRMWTSISARPIGAVSPSIQAIAERTIASHRGVSIAYRSRICAGASPPDKPSRNRMRALNNRLITVPTGMSSDAASSGYDSPSKCRSMTISRSVGESAAMARSTARRSSTGSVGDSSRSGRTA